MTVDELRDALVVYPGDMRVVVDGYEGGYDEPHFHLVHMRALVAAEAGGMFGDYTSWEWDKAVGPMITAVVVSRDE